MEVNRVWAIRLAARVECGVSTNTDVHEFPWMNVRENGECLNEL